MISFSCTHCGRTLRVKDELAGKKGKCLQCGHALLVPATVPADSSRDDATLAPQEGFASSHGLSGTAVADTHAPSTGGTHTPNAPAPGEAVSILAPPQQPGELGRLGQYRVLKVLGQGGMGVVFKAEDPQLERCVALKAMLPGFSARPEARQRFLREAKLAASVKHDHIVTIHQVSEDRGVPFLAMEFLEGEPLDVRLQREPTLPIPEVLRIGREVAEGLAAAHERGLIHRDIKPANIWLESRSSPLSASGRGAGGEGLPSSPLSASGRGAGGEGLPSSPLSASGRGAGGRGDSRVKILDFGLARGEGKGQEQLTQAGAIMGTPAFMAPEQARGESVDARCDLFSLGCVLYRMCAGELPFKGNDPISTLVAVATENPESVHTLNAAVPPDMATLVNRLLEKDPAYRPATARDVVEELAALEQAMPAAGKAGSGAFAAMKDRDPGSSRTNTKKKRQHSDHGPPPPPPLINDLPPIRRPQNWLPLALALSGAAVLLLGVFVPILSVGALGHVNYFNNGKGKGTILLVLAVISVLLTLGRVYRGLWATGMLSVGLLAFTFAVFQLRMAENNAAAMVQLELGWAVLALGVILIVSAAIVAESQQRPRHALAIQLFGAAAIPVTFVLVGLATWGVPKMVAAWERSQIAAREAKEKEEAEALVRTVQERAREAADQKAQETKERAKHAAQEAKERDGTNQTVVPLADSIWGTSGSVAAGWADAGSQAVQQGSVRVHVTSVRSDGGNFHVHLRIENTGGKPGLFLHGWGIRRQATEGGNHPDSAARLMDHAGVRWNLVPLPPEGLLAGQAGQRASIPPDRPIADVVVFRVPRERAEFLRLELPAAHFGGKGQLRLQIPRSMLLLESPKLWRSEAIPELLSFLKGTRQPLRLKAAHALGELGPVAATATARLITVLNDSEAAMRVAACDALGAIGAAAGEAYVPILKTVADRDDSVRTAATAALARVASPTKSDVPELLKLLTDHASPLRARGATALRIVKPAAREAFPALIEALHDADKDVVRESLATLKVLGKPPSAHAGALGAALKVRQADVRAYVLSALERLADKASPAVPALTAALRDSDAAFRKRAAQVLRKVDSEAEIPAFAAALKDENEEVRNEAVAALAAAGPRAKSVILDLLTATNDKNALVRVKAVRLLYHIDTASRDPLPVFRDALKDKDVQVRREAAEGLAEMGSRATDAVSDLAAALKDSDGGVRLRVAAALNKTGTKDKNLIAALIRALEEEKLHKEVAPILLRMDVDAVPALIKALDDKKVVVRLAAVTLLGKIGPAAKDAYRPVLSLYRTDTDAQIHKAADAALGKIRAK